MKKSNGVLKVLLSAAVFVTGVARAESSDPCIRLDDRSDLCVHRFENGTHGVYSLMAGMMDRVANPECKGQKSMLPTCLAKESEAVARNLVLKQIVVTKKSKPGDDPFAELERGLEPTEEDHNRTNDLFARAKKQAAESGSQAASVFRGSSNSRKLSIPDEGHGDAQIKGSVPAK